MLNQAFCSKAVCHVPLSPLHHLFGKKAIGVVLPKLWKRLFAFLKWFVSYRVEINSALSKSAFANLQVRFVISPFHAKSCGSIFCVSCCGMYKPLIGFVSYHVFYEKAIGFGKLFAPTVAWTLEVGGALFSFTLFSCCNRLFELVWCLFS